MHLGEVAQPIGEIDDTGFVPDVIARVKDVAVGACRATHARPDDGDQDESGAMHREVRREQHGGELIKRVAGAIRR